MGPKRNTKRIEEAVIAAEDPLVVEAKKSLTKWNERVSTTGRKIQHVQYLLGLLAAEMGSCSVELSDVYESANLLSSLCIVEYRHKMYPQPQPLQVKKQRLRRENLAKAPLQPPLAENSTEALIASMDEKKRLKVTNALVVFFKRNTSDISAAPPSQPQGVSLSQFSTGTPPTTLDPSGRVQQGGMSFAFSESTSAEQRRPKEVPQELWDEISKLRLRRISLESRLAELTGGIELQLERFDVLTKNYRVATYATKKIEQEILILRQKKTRP